MKSNLCLLLALGVNFLYGQVQIDEGAVSSVCAPCRAVYRKYMIAGAEYSKDGANAAKRSEWLQAAQVYNDCIRKNCKGDGYTEGDMPDCGMCKGIEDKDIEDFLQKNCPDCLKQFMAVVHECRSYNQGKIDKPLLIKLNSDLEKCARDHSCVLSQGGGFAQTAKDLKTAQEILETSRQIDQAAKKNIAALNQQGGQDINTITVLQQKEKEERDAKDKLNSQNEKDHAAHGVTEDAFEDMLARRDSPVMAPSEIQSPDCPPLPEFNVQFTDKLPLIDTVTADSNLRFIVTYQIIGKAACCEEPQRYSKLFCKIVKYEWEVVNLRLYPLIFDYAKIFSLGGYNETMFHGKCNYFKEIIKDRDLSWSFGKPNCDPANISRGGDALYAGQSICGFAFDILSISNGLPYTMTFDLQSRKIKELDMPQYFQSCNRDDNHSDYTLKTCAHCNGSGKCTPCNGTGKVKCARCKGTGNADGLPDTPAGKPVPKQAGYAEAIQIDPERDGSMQKAKPIANQTSGNTAPADNSKAKTADNEVRAKCTVCKGKGYVKCKSCDIPGNGKCWFCMGVGREPKVLRTP